jgi:hypothetical protein
MARVEIRDLFAVVDVVHARQVHLMYRATLLDGKFRRRARRASRSALFEPEPSPGTTSPFQSVRFALEKFWRTGPRAWNGCTPSPCGQPPGLKPCRARPVAQ